MTTERLADRILRPDGGSDGDAKARHRIHRALRHALERHPAVLAARGFPDGMYTQVEADVDASYFGSDARTASLRVSWQPAADQGTAVPEDRPRTSLTANFVIHYSDSSGYECGVHLEPNPHVSGQLHLQHRETPDASYSYEPFTLEARSPVGVLWEVLEAIQARIGNR